MTTPPEPTVEFRCRECREELSAGESWLHEECTGEAEAARLTADNQQLRDRLALAEAERDRLRDEIVWMRERAERAEAMLAQLDQANVTLSGQNTDLAESLALAEQALADAGLREERLRAVVDAAQEWALVRFDGKPYHPNTDDFAAEAKLATAVARLKDFLAARLDETAPTDCVVPKRSLDRTA